MYFAMLNGEIVHQSGGTRSMDGLVGAMVAIQRDEGKEPTEQDWIALLRHDLGDKGVRIHEGMMSGAMRMVPRSDAFGPCFRRVEAQVRPYDLGFGGPQLKRLKVVEKLLGALHEPGAQRCVAIVPPFVETALDHRIGDRLAQILGQLARQLGKAAVVACRCGSVSFLEITDNTGHERDRAEAALLPAMIAPSLELAQQAADPVERT